jgi:hypothetical protein
MNQAVSDITIALDAPLDEFNQKVLRGARTAIKAEVAELRRLKLPVIRSVNGKPFDFNPDTNPDAPPWSESDI